jgi:uncharacterized membrane protein
VIRGVFGEFGRITVATLVGTAVQLAGPRLLGLDRDNVWASQLLFWDALAVTYVVLSWIVFLRSTAGDLADWARRLDAPTRGVLHALFFGRTATSALWLVVMGSVFGLVAAAYVLPRAAELAPGQRPLLSGLAFAAILSAWFAAHTAYTFHYARQQHRSGGAGLDFPGDERLTLLDFAYFSFGVGKTLGTTDVTVLTRAMRRTVVFHGLFSFVFNSAVLAVALTYVTAV